MLKIDKLKTKDIVEALLGALLAMLILMGLNSMVYPLITTIFASTAFLEPANILFALMFFVFGIGLYAKKVKEKVNVVNIISVMLITMFFASIITLIIPSVILVYELTISGIAVFLSAIFLGLVGAKLGLKKLKI